MGSLGRATPFAKGMKKNFLRAENERNRKSCRMISQYGSNGLSQR